MDFFDRRQYWKNLEKTQQQQHRESLLIWSGGFNGHKDEVSFQQSLSPGATMILVSDLPNSPPLVSIQLISQETEKGASKIIPLSGKLPSGNFKGLLDEGGHFGVVLTNWMQDYVKVDLIRSDLPTGPLHVNEKANEIPPGQSLTVSGFLKRPSFSSITNVEEDPLSLDIYVTPRVGEKIESFDVAELFSSTHWEVSDALLLPSGLLPSPSPWEELGYHINHVNWNEATGLLYHNHLKTPVCRMTVLASLKSLSLRTIRHSSKTSTSRPNRRSIPLNRPSRSFANQKIKKIIIESDHSTSSMT